MTERIIVFLKDGSRLNFGAPGEDWAHTEDLGFISIICIKNGEPEVVREFLSSEVDHVESI